MRGKTEELNILHQKALLMFESGDVIIARVARELGVARQTVSGWYQRWEKNGAAGLELEKPGPEPKLTEIQWQEILGALLLGARANGYDTELWTLERIADLVYKKTNVRYHPSRICTLLHRFGWSCQKPQRSAKERNEEKIASWVAEDWPQIKKGH